MAIIKHYYPAFPGQKRQLREIYEVDEEDGYKNGFYQSWFRNGQEHITAAFKKDIPVGSWIEKHPNGRVAVEKSYDNEGHGWLEGSFDTYRLNGGHDFHGVYFHNAENGHFIRYDSQNRVKSDDLYQNGVRENSVLYHYDSIERTRYYGETPIEQVLAMGGRIENVQQLSGGRCIGSADFCYNAENDLISKTCWDSDGYLAQRDLYYPGHHGVRSSEKYTDKGRKSVYSLFFESGRVQETGERSGNKTVGMRTLYFDNQTNSVREKCPFDPKTGLEEGVCVRFDSEGNQVERRLYHKGKPIIQKHMIELLFGKKTEKKLRDDLAKRISKVLAGKEDATLQNDFRQFHLAKSDFPRPTALNLNQSKSRV